MNNLKQTKTTRWRFQITWLDPKRKNVDKDVWDILDPDESGWIKVISIDRVDDQNRPHMTYENYPKSLIREYKLIELTRPDEPLVIAPKGIISTPN